MSSDVTSGSSKQQELIDSLRLQLSYHQANARRVLPDSDHSQRLQIHFLQRRVFDLSGMLEQAERGHSEHLVRVNEELQDMLLARQELMRDHQRSAAVTGALLHELRHLATVPASVLQMQLANVQVVECFWRERIEREALRYFLLRHTESLADACVNASVTGTTRSASDAAAAVHRLAAEVGSILDMFTSKSSRGSSGAVYDTSSEMLHAGDFAEHLSAEAIGSTRILYPFAFQLRLAMKGIVVDEELQHAKVAMRPRVALKCVAVNTEPTSEVGVPAELYPIEAAEGGDDPAISHTVILPFETAGTTTGIANLSSGASLEQHNVSASEANDQSAASACSASTVVIEDPGVDLRLQQAMEEVAHLRRELAKERHQRMMLEEEKVKWLIERSQLQRELKQSTPANEKSPAVERIPSPNRSAARPHSRREPSRQQYSKEHHQDQHRDVDDAIDRLELATRDLLSLETIARSTPEGGMRQRMLREMSSVHQRITNSETLSRARQMLEESRPKTPCTY